MQRLHRTHRLTSLIVTHNSGLSRRCDRVLGLEHGRLVPHAVAARDSFPGAPGAKLGGESS
jgi:ABC-type lipoprotein export system ATPase subunit